jgi:hypothetical protein
MAAAVPEIEVAHDRDALASGVCQRSCRLVSSITHERVLALQARCGQAVPTG